MMGNPSLFNIQAAKEKAIEFSKKYDCDVILYNGQFHVYSAFALLQKITECKQHKNALLILVTNGGHAAAAYKIARHFQDAYNCGNEGNFRVFVTGMCKSAGTLLSIGANEIIFSPYGELGPLDVQSIKDGIIGGSQSGLVLQESLSALETQALKTYGSLIESFGDLPGGVHFQEAAHAAARVIDVLYSPIISQIDPENIGEKARAMRVGEDYGKRLNLRSKNLKNEAALTALVGSYCDHGFVIDQSEATSLFNSVRGMNDDEKALIEPLGILAIRQMENTKCEFLSYEAPEKKEEDNATETGASDSKTNGADSKGAIGKTTPNSKQPKTQFPSRKRLEPIDAIS